MKKNPQERIKNPITALDQPNQKIPRTFLHQTAKKELVISQNFLESLSFSANGFHSLQPRISPEPKLWADDIRAAIHRGAPHKDSPYAHSIKLIVIDRIRFLKMDSIKLVSVIISHCTQVQKLDLTLLDKKAIDCKILESLGGQLGRGLTNLRHLSLKFQFGKEEHVQKLIKELGQNQSHLTSLDLDLSVYRWSLNDDHNTFTDKGLKLIASEMSKQLIGLKSLGIDFKRVTSIGGQIFISEIAKLRNLQKLRFSFTGEQVSKEALGTIISTICNNLTGLQHLEFRLIYDRNVTLSSFWFILAKTTQHLIQLKHLSFNFASSSPGSVDGEKAYTFKELKDLRVLDLTLKESASSDLVVLPLTSIITQYFPNLEKMTINFIHLKNSFKKKDMVNLSKKSNILSQQCLETLLFETSCSLINLHTITIKLTDCELKNQSFCVQILDKSVSRLKHLTLVFDRCMTITEAFFKILGGNIALCFKNLESLTLTLDRNKIQRKALETFGEQIRGSLINLKALNITISPNDCDSFKSLLIIKQRGY